MQSDNSTANANDADARYRAAINAADALLAETAAWLRRQATGTANEATPPSAAATPSTSDTTAPPSTAGEDTPSPTLTAALKYIAKGWSIVPLRPRTKAPAVKKVAPYLDGSSRMTEDEARDYWTKHPDAGIAIIMGAPSGLVAIDVDIRNGADPEQVQRDCPTELVALTGGGGLHLFVRHRGSRVPKGKTSRPGVDRQSDGSYVVAAPSVHPTSGEPYVWLSEGEPGDLPAWVLEGAPTSAADDPKHPAGWAEAELAAAATPIGSQNDMLTQLAGWLAQQHRPDDEAVERLWDWAQRLTQHPHNPWRREQITDMVRRMYEKEAAKPPTFTVLSPPSGTDGGNGGSVNAAPAGPHRTDLGNSERFVTDHQSDLRFCRTYRHWFARVGTHWAHDQTDEHMRRAKQTVRSMYAQAAVATDDTRAALIKHALASESAKSLDAMTKLAASAPGIAIAPEQLDTDPWLFNVLNGTLDLRTGELREHRRDDYITKLAPVVYDATAECPTWLAFLRSVFAGDDTLIRFVQRAAGYSLVGDTRERVFFILYGGGKNGKTTLLAVLSEVMGDYAADTHSDTLLVKRGDAIPNDLAALVNVRFVTASEVEEGRRLAEALVKKITGDEMISARFMRGEWFSYRPRFKLWLATNHKPVIRGGDDGIWDRIRLIPFNVRFVDPDNPNDGASASGPRMDKTLRAKLLAEASGILRWAVEGCMAWQREGLGAPSAVTQATGDYRDEMDHVRDFIDECCARGDGFTVGTAELFAQYIQWCTASRERSLSRQAFAARLDKIGVGQAKAAGERSRGMRCGITLRRLAAVSDPRRSA